MYLALEGIYLPFKAEFLINPTLRRQLVRSGLSITNRIFTLSDVAFQQT